MCIKKYDTVIQNVVRSGVCHGHERKTNRAILARRPQGRPDLCAPEQWRRILDVADLRQYIYEQMGRIRTNALVMDGLYGNDNGHVQDISKNNGHNENAHA
jgi:hypothetical protein